VTPAERPRYNVTDVRSAGGALGADNQAMEQTQTTPQAVNMQVERLRSMSAHECDDRATYERCLQSYRQMVTQRHRNSADDLSMAASDVQRANDELVSTLAAVAALVSQLDTMLQSL
jgi:hypothetical protein